MNKEQVLILDRRLISDKLRRMAYEIWERNANEQELYLVGIENGGVAVANTLAAVLREISGLQVQVIAIKMNKKNPLADQPVIAASLDGKSVVLVDDVANSGRTLLYALKPILVYAPARIMIAVLVDRKHKSFPITPDIVGHTVSTTLQEHIEVEHEGDDLLAAYLK